MLRTTSFALFLVTGASAFADTFTPNAAADYARGHNRQLAAARLRIEEARGRLTASGRLPNPELEVGFSHNLKAPEHTLDASLVQRFPITARLRLEKAVSKAQLAAAEAEIRDAERRLTAEVRSAATKVLAIRFQRELRQQQLTNSREQSEFVTKRVATGEASSVDATQVELEATQLEVEVLQLEALRTAINGELRTLLGLSPDASVEIAGTLSPPGTIPRSGSPGENRADLQVARHQAAAARSAIDLAEARRWDDFGIGITGSRERTEDAPDGFSYDNFLGFKLSIPLPLWNRNEGQIAEARAAAARAGKEVDALALTVRNEAEAARSEMATLAKLIGQMDAGLLPKATQVEEQLRASYSAGQTALTEVLRARSRRLDLAQRRVDALRDYHLARIRYEAALGSRQPTGGPGK